MARYRLTWGIPGGQHFEDEYEGLEHDAQSEAHIRAVGLVYSSAERIDPPSGDGIDLLEALIKDAFLKLPQERQAKLSEVLHRFAGD